MNNNKYNHKILYILFYYRLSVVIKKNSKKSRGVTPASWPNLCHGLCQSWPLNHLHMIDWLYHVSSPPVS